MADSRGVVGWRRRHEEQHDAPDGQPHAGLAHFGRWVRTTSCTLDAPHAERRHRHTEQHVNVLDHEGPERSRVLERGTPEEGGHGDEGGVDSDEAEGGRRDPPAGPRALQGQEEHGTHRQHAESEREDGKVQRAKKVGRDEDGSDAQGAEHAVADPLRPGPRTSKKERTRTTTSETEQNRAVRG
jgi:hypothetical protein